MLACEYTGVAHHGKFAISGLLRIKEKLSQYRIEVFGHFAPEVLRLEGKTAFTYGPLVLAVDTQKQPELDISASFILEGKPRQLEPCTSLNETVRFSVPVSGGNTLLLTDYASCGKNWLEKPSRISVWMNIEEDRE